MFKHKDRLLRSLGIFGVIFCLLIFIWRPSFPTPDKLLVFLTFVFMAIGQAKAMLRRMLPFMAVLLIYESFRSVADKLNSHVNYSFAPRMDRLLFGRLPTDWLQAHLWHGHVRWYDFAFYIPYMLFFVLPFTMAILIWKTKEEYYWRFVWTFLVVAFGAFLTFLLFPAAPPWLASQLHYIEPIRRISSDVWFAMGLHDFPSFYNHIAPNPVAAVPSLHSAWATLISLFAFKIYGRRWGALSLVYPLLIYVGVVYQGEHYAFDVITGALYAVVGYLVTPWILRVIGDRMPKRFHHVSTQKN